MSLSLTSHSSPKEHTGHRLRRLLTTKQKASHATVGFGWNERNFFPVTPDEQWWLGNPKDPFSSLKRSSCAIECSQVGLAWMPAQMGSASLSARKPHGQFFSMPDHTPCACWDNMISSSLACFCLAKTSPLAQMQRKTVPGIHCNQHQEVNSKETERMWENSAPQGWGLTFVPTNK